MAILAENRNSITRHAGKHRALQVKKDAGGQEGRGRYIYSSGRHIYIHTRSRPTRAHHQDRCTAGSSGDTHTQQQQQQQHRQQMMSEAGMHEWANGIMACIYVSYTLLHLQPPSSAYFIYMIYIQYIAHYLLINKIIPCYMFV